MTLEIEHEVASLKSLQQEPCMVLRPQLRGGVVCGPGIEPVEQAWATLEETKHQACQKLNCPKNTLLLFGLGQP